MLLLFLLLLETFDPSQAARCPVSNSTTVVYSTVPGVGPASRIWVEDFLWWWQQNGDERVEYVGLTAQQLQQCDLASFPNLRVYINPGGDAYSQLTAMGVEGRENIISFVQRNQNFPSAYVGFCAGGYIASHDYLWETIYEGPGYYNFKDTPPLSIFPHTVEGSIVDINDDQYGDQHDSKFRMVNVSNGHQMLYYGGSTFGYNGALDPTDPSSSIYDPDVEVLVYYSDFYGFKSYNIPAAWRYHNALMTSVHPEADNCTYAQDSDCPPEGTLPTSTILQNRAWLCEYINQAAQTNFKIPAVPIPPIFDTTPPHSDWPVPLCYQDNELSEKLLFCDNFDSLDHAVPYGLSPQFQRNQTDYNYARPWNTTYISTWNENTKYAYPHSGNGYAVAVTLATPSHVSSIITKTINVDSCSGKDATLSFYVQGNTVEAGFFAVNVIALNGDEEIIDPYSISWRNLFTSSLSPTVLGWEYMSFTLKVATKALKVKFDCAAGPLYENYCAIDTLSVQCQS